MVPLDRFRVILLDMNSRFMFGEDRFGPAEDFGAALVSTRAANLTASTSEFGHGWELAGFQRLYDQGDGINITESGTGRFFWHQGADPDGTQRYGSLSGDFTVVTRTPAGAYERRYPDGATDYDYVNGNLYRVRDPKGQFYHFHHDALGRVGSVVDPRGQWSYYNYDRAGNPTYMRNRRQQEIRAGYNALNQREWRDADGARTTWSYDPNGRWMEEANAESHNRVEYDIAGRPTTAVTTLGGVTYTQVITPDAQGRRGQMDVHGPWSGPRTIAHTYTARGQLETLRDLGGATTTFQYNDDGQLSTRSYPTGLDAFQGYASNHVGTSSGYSVGAVANQFGADYKIDARGLVDARVHYRGYQLARIYGYDRRGWLSGFNDRKFTADLIGNGRPCTGGEAEGCLPPDPNCSAGEQHDPDTGVCLPQGPVLGWALLAADAVQFGMCVADR